MQGLPVLDALSHLADFLAIVGFFITIWLLVEAKSISATLAQRVRVPQIVEELDRLAVVLFRNLKHWKAREKEIMSDLAGIKGRVASLQKKVDGDEQRLAKQILDDVSERKRSLLFFKRAAPLTEEDAWAAYTKLIQLIAQCRERDKDARWNVPNE